MARRNLPTSKDKDVEASQAELAVLEGKKNQTQDETLAIAKKKQELVAAFAEVNKQLDEELSVKRAEHVREIDKMEQKYRNVEAALVTIEAVQKETKEKTIRLEGERDSVKVEIAELFDVRTNSKAEVNRLMVLKHNLDESVKDARTDYKELENKILSLQKQLPLLLEQIKTATKEYSDLSALVAAYYSDINELDTRKRKDISVLEQLSKDISDKIKQKADLEMALTKLQDSLEKIKQNISTREADIAAKAGELSRLETRIDEKIIILKEAKKEFTTEHLLRMGIRD